MFGLTSHSDIHRQAGAYFDRRAELFDSLYSDEKNGAFMRFMNRHFRSDIYKRYYLTIEHCKAVQARSVLDVGIGSGRYAQGYIEAGVKRVVGVDISSSMLELARSHAAGLLGSAGVFEFVNADISNFHTADKFDVVVAMGFFDYVPDTVAALIRLRDFCHHSVIASFPSTNFYRTPIRRVRYRFKRCPVYFFTHKQIQQIARDAGFADCAITKIAGAGMDFVATLRR